MQNRRLATMEAMENRLEEMEQFSDDISEYRHMHEEIDELEDEIERYYAEKKTLDIEDLKGTLREPSLVLCWFIVAVVSGYVVFLGFQGTVPPVLRDEL